jgi:DNA-binding protein H-NS
MVGSKRATSTDRDMKLRVLNNILAKQEKLVEAKKRWHHRANAWLREVQQVVDVAPRVVASMAL